MMLSAETAQFRSGCDQLLDLINKLRAKTESIIVEDLPSPKRKKRAKRDVDGS